MVSTVKPKARAMPWKPISAPAKIAAPQPPKTSQKVPKNSAARRRLMGCMCGAPPRRTPCLDRGRTGGREPVPRPGAGTARRGRRYGAPGTFAPLRGTHGPCAHGTWPEWWELPTTRSKAMGEGSTIRALVAYESMFGNTERVAQAVAAGLGLEDIEAT